MYNQKEKTMSKVPKLRFQEFKGKWEEKKLGDITKYENGKAHENDISEEGKYIVVNSKFISTEGLIKKYSDKAHCLAKKNGILMVLNDVPNGKAISKCFIVKENNCYTVNQRICVLSPKEGIIANYLFYILDRNPYFLAFDDGVKQTNLKKEEVLNFNLSIPADQKEQQKIADCLSSLDELIEARREKIASLKEYKKGLLQQLFPEEVSKSIPPLIFSKLPKIRFAGFEGEWEEVTIESIFLITRGNVLPMTLLKQEYSEEYPYPVYSSQTKNNGLAGYYNEFLYENAITWTTDGANAGEVNYRKEKFYCTNVCGVLISEKGYANKCIAELINSVSKNYVSYVGNPKLMNGVMGSIKIQIPTEQKEQQKISDCLLSLDEKIVAETEQVAQLQQHKKGLLQQLLV